MVRIHLICDIIADLQELFNLGTICNSAVQGLLKIELYILVEDQIWLLLLSICQVLQFASLRNHFQLFWCRFNIVVPCFSFFHLFDDWIIKGNSFKKLWNWLPYHNFNEGCILSVLRFSHRKYSFCIDQLSLPNIR